MTIFSLYEEENQSIAIANSYGFFLFWNRKEKRMLYYVLSRKRQTYYFSIFILWKI